MNVGFDLDYGNCTILGLEEGTSKAGRQYGILSFVDSRQDFYSIFIAAEKLDEVRSLQKGQEVGLVFHVSPQYRGLSGVRVEFTRVRY